MRSSTRLGILFLLGSPVKIERLRAVIYILVDFIINVNLIDDFFGIVMFLY